MFANLCYLIECCREYYTKSFDYRVRTIYPIKSTAIKRIRIPEVIIAVDDGSKSPDSILFLFFMKLLRAITCIKPPDMTRIIPIDAENGAETFYVIISNRILSSIITNW